MYSTCLTGSRVRFLHPNPSAPFLLLVLTSAIISKFGSANVPVSRINVFLIINLAHSQIVDEERLCKFASRYSLLCSWNSSGQSAPHSLQEGLGVLGARPPC